MPNVALTLCGRLTSVTLLPSLQDGDTHDCVSSLTTFLLLGMVRMKLLLITLTEWVIGGSHLRKNRDTVEQDVQNFQVDITEGTYLLE